MAHRRRIFAVRRILVKEQNSDQLYYGEDQNDADFTGSDSAVRRLRHSDAGCTRPARDSADKIG